MTPHLSFGGLLKSEWIKLWSVRATWWCFAISVAMTILIALLAAFASGGITDSQGNTVDPGAGIAGYEVVQLATVGVRFSELVVVVLGALVITGEFGTGMIRSTFMAAPHRLGAVIAKALVFGVTTFVLGLVSILLATAITLPIFAGNGLHPDLSDAGFWLAIIGSAGFLALIGVFATAIGTLLRNSAAAIATALGIVLVLPIIVTLFASLTNLDWVRNAASFLPSEAGARMYAFEPPEVSSAIGGDSTLLTLDPWVGGLVLAAWVAVIGVIALVTVRRRDV